MEGLRNSIRADVPRFCNTWTDIKVAIELYQTVEQLAGGPYHSLVLGKCRIERGYTRRLVIFEYLFLGVVIIMLATRNSKECY